MLSSLFITLREGLEAALIVGIILGVLRKLGHRDQAMHVWGGVIVAVAVSLGAGVLIVLLGLAFEGRAAYIFEGVATLTAAGVLTWMIFWMQRRGSHMQEELESGVRQAMSGGTSGALFGLAFVAVLREGIETALFLSAALFSSTALQVLIGGLAGLAVAIALGWLMFVAGMRLNLKLFFRVTGVILLLFAAGLVAYGIHELQEASLLPTLIEHVWDLNPILNERSLAGGLLKAVFGYNADPSLLEAIAYTVYLLVVSLVAWWVGRDPQPTRATVSS